MDSASRLGGARRWTTVFAIALAGVVAVTLGIGALVVQFRAGEGDGGSVYFVGAGLCVVVGGLILIGAAVLKHRESALDENPYVGPLTVGGGMLVLPAAAVILPAVL